MANYFLAGIRVFILLLFGFISPLSYAWEETSGTDVRALSLGQIRALSHELLNPAYTPFQSQKQVYTSVYNRFRMKELNTISVSGIIPNRLIDAGFKLSEYGFEDYMLIQAQMALAKKLTPGFSIGANLIYLNENSILEDKANYYLQADIGIFWRINDFFDFAITTENLLHTMPSSQIFLHTGVNYRLTSTCRFLLETSVDFQNNFHVSSGFEYDIAELFSIRGGFRSNPKTPSMGFAYNGKQWKIETAFLIHPVLGSYGGIGFGYFF
jgi:hypothetical protein